MVSRNVFIVSNRVMMISRALFQTLLLTLGKFTMPIPNVLIPFQA